MPAQRTRLNAPWRLPGGGLVPLSEFLGLPPGYATGADREEVDLEFYGAILEGKCVQCAKRTGNPDRAGYTRT